MSHSLSSRSGLLSTGAVHKQLLNVTRQRRTGDCIGGSASGSISKTIGRNIMSVHSQGHAHGGGALKNGSIIVVSDLDWTMVNHHQAGDGHPDLQEFNALWQSLFQHDEHSLLMYSSGRSPVLYNELAKEVPLLEPDLLVCSVGTEMVVPDKDSQEGTRSRQYLKDIHSAWESYLDGQGWNRATVEKVVNDLSHLLSDQIRMQQDSEQRPHKVSYNVQGDRVPDFITSVKDSLEKDHGMSVNIIYSGGQDLDVLPARASKGKALEFFLDQCRNRDELGDNTHVIVCGDSGNDVELFQVPGVHGCIVSNAHKELREWYDAYGTQNEKMFYCSKEGPAGIVECLRHFGFI